MHFIDRYSPPNLPSLSQQDRIAWNGLTNYLPMFADSISSSFPVFASLAERDSHFATPSVGDFCLVQTDGNTSATFWYYTEYLSSTFNVYEIWMPYDTGWTQFAASMSGVTVGDGNVTSWYRRRGPDCEVKFRFVMGTTSAMSNPFFILPFLAVAPLSGGGTEEWSWPVVIGDFGTTLFRGHTRFQATNAIRPLADNVTGTYVQDTGITNTIPMVWTTSDYLVIPYMIYTMDIENIVFTS